MVNIVNIEDDELDALAHEDVERTKEQIWRELDAGVEEMVEGDGGQTQVLAEGDSWFNYSVAGFDIIDFIARFGPYKVIRRASPGDTLENMVYGTEFRNGSFRPKEPQLSMVLRDVVHHQPRFFLFSGGGNDVAGAELEGLLNHAESGLPPLRRSHLDFLVNKTMNGAYQRLMEKVWEIDPKIDIITHGYGDAQPDGRGIGRILGYNFIGPWLRPALTKKRILVRAAQDGVVRELIAALNELQARLARDNERFHHIDPRPVLSASDWENELHLTNSAYRRVARLFDEKMRELSQND